MKTVVSEWKKLACQMTQSLGQRAIRSMHIEVLYHNWLNNERNRRQANGLWQRLQQIDQHLRLPQKQKIEKIIGKIRHFCDAVELRNTEFVKDILPISAGLSAALGELSNISEFYSENEAEVTRKLINFYRTLPLTQLGYQVPFTKSHINEIENLFNVISVNTLDIVLLDPLEGVYKSPVYRYEAVNLLAWLQDGSECKSSSAEFSNSPSKRGEYSKVFLQQLSLGEQLSQYCQTIEPKISEIEQNFERLRNLLKE